ncbi:2-oxoglutarate dehydrogenase E1 component [Paenibacillus marinisediminis]
MAKGHFEPQQVWKSFIGPNEGYIQQVYERYVEDANAVDANYREMFERYGPPTAGVEYKQVTDDAAVSGNLPHMEAVGSAVRLADGIRVYGHLAADIDPLGFDGVSDIKRLEAEIFDVSDEELRALPSRLVWQDAPEDISTAYDAIKRLRELYTGPIAFDFGHVHDRNERKWLRKKVESGVKTPMTKVERIALLHSLLQVEQFETFLHRIFVGQKRFSIEGVDVLVPMLEAAVREFTLDGVEHVMMGMAHRGRLNVLAHVLGKSYELIFSEFHHSPNKDQVPSEGSMGINYGWSGDVKYHLGANLALEQEGRVQTRVTLSHNPSHLEFVNPVVEGFTRAAQDDRQAAGYPVQDTKRAAMLLMHGDAAFPGEGIVAETLNFNKLRGYQNGGTVHIIVNNRIGFTTDRHDSRSTMYASDPAKGYEIPIVHVNADDPEACIAAIRMAVEYRETFNKDFLIDLVGYRRHGHNEMDDAAATQPIIYDRIAKHATVANLYAEHLMKEGVIAEKQFETMIQAVQDKLQQAYDKIKAEPVKSIPAPMGTKQLSREVAPEQLTTAITAERARRINSELLQTPEGFSVYPKLNRILQRRSAALEENGMVDWSLAEALAFGSILEDGQPIRLSGQDSERGTFAQRHLVLHDEHNGSTYCSLHGLSQAKASFAVYNSPLSEASVLGFEYGYNVFAPETLVLWEGQFGDFTNAAQVIIDQFISAGLAKWRQYSSLIMLLPHGYEGQGPEHSSARLERFLQLSAEENWMVANLSSAAQYFHMLRRQAALSGTMDARPIVLMAPKSLLRNPRAVSSIQEITEGRFRPILEEPLLGSAPEKVERLVLCSGKVSLELADRVANDADRDWSWLHIARVEQLYPMPEAELKDLIGRMPALKEIVWVQEEPRNMGAWSYMHPRLLELAGDKQLRYVGRGERSSTATGYADVHAYEQNLFLTEALMDTRLVEALVR